MTGSAAKHVVRKQALRWLRQHGKTNPAELAAQSEQLCAHLATYLTEKYLSPPPPPPPISTSTSGTATAASSPLAARLATLHLCAYLPLYYEVSLLPLLERLAAALTTAAAAASAESGKEGSPTVRVYLPCILEPHASVRPPHRPKQQPSPPPPPPPPAAAAAAPPSPPWPWQLPLEGSAERLARVMVFAELHFDSPSPSSRYREDLETFFQPQGAYQIRELHPQELAKLFDTTATTAADQRKESASITACDRRLLLCDRWQALFPDVPAPDGPLAKAHNSHHHHNTDPTGDNGSSTAAATAGAEAYEMLVVLVPGVLFDRGTGARLGKGGGFYDRFLTYQQRAMMRQRVDVNTTTTKERDHADAEQSDGGPARPARWGMEMIGIALEEQVVDSVPTAITAATAADVTESEKAKGDTAPSSFCTTNSNTVIVVGGCAAAPCTMVPREECDVCMDTVATPTGVYGCTAPSV